MFAIAALPRAAGLGQEAIHDELHHVLAARGLLEDGLPAVEGAEPYRRAYPLTLAIAGLFAAFGESLAVARLPALVAGALIPVALFLWLSWLRERAAAWLAALLAAFDPAALVSSQWARFYTIQELSFTLAAISVFALLARRPRAAAAALLGGAALAGLGFAIYLQLSCAIGAAGLALSALPICGRPLLERWRASERPGLWLALGLAGAVLVVGGSVWVGLWRWAWYMASYTDLWGAGGAGEFRYYYGILLERWPGLWPLWPLWLLLAARRQPVLALLSGSVFALAFAVHSAMAWKAWRYFEYAMPFFFVSSAIGAVEGLRLLRSALPAWLTPLFPAPPPPVVLRAASALLAVTVAGFALVANRALLETARLVRVGDPTLSFPGMIHAEGTLSWSRAAERIAPLLAGADAVVASDALKALYYLGRVDYELNRDHLSGGDALRPELSLDGPSGRPVVSEPATLRRILSCHTSGVVVAERRLWGAPWSVPSETVRLLEAHTAPHELPPEWGIVVQTWNVPLGSEAACPVRAAGLSAERSR